MSHRVIIIGVLLSAFVSLLLYDPVQSTPPTQAVVTTPSSVYRLPTTTPDVPPGVSVLVFDLATGLELLAVQPDDVRPIASLTKLVTAGVVLESLPLTATTTITPGAVETLGRAGKLAVGEEYSVHELLFPLLLESSNDAAVAFVSVTTDLVPAMNRLADRLHASHTVFADPAGLSPENQSTAREVALLTRTLATTSPHIFDITTLSQYIGTHTGWQNTIPLSSDPAFRGGKQGYTHEAGHTMVAVFAEEFEGGTRDVGYVVLGSPDAAETVAILREFVATAVDYN
jgi:D-alanyl-D-alanine carboxypeptidase